MPNKRSKKVSKKFTKKTSKTPQRSKKVSKKFTKKTSKTQQKGKGMIGDMVKACFGMNCTNSNNNSNNVENINERPAVVAPQNRPNYGAMDYNNDNNSNYNNSNYSNNSSENPCNEENNELEAISQLKNIVECCDRRNIQWGQNGTDMEATLEERICCEHPLTRMNTRCNPLTEEDLRRQAEDEEAALANNNSDSSSLGGKKRGKKNKKIKKTKKVRKHQGITQTGGNIGKLRKGYRYSGKKLKSGLPQIIKCKSKRC